MPDIAHVENQLDNRGAFLNDVVVGLSQPLKQISSKYFYDQPGSELFDQICDLDEYYLTRSELEIICNNVEEMACQLDRGVRLVEYGSGSSIKTELLLDELIEPAAYAPVDISEDHLLATVKRLQTDYPDIEITPVIADFTQSFELPATKVLPSHNAVFFPGSTIGNFQRDSALRILKQISRLVQNGGGLLIGIDLHKDDSIIELAYNDSQGVTAAFNKNLLTRINRELGGDFDLNRFQHQSFYNKVQKRIESSLVSEIDQTVVIDEQEFDFEAGEEIHTEYSHKYTINGFAEFAGQAGFELHNSWTDEKEYFGVLHLVVVNQGSE